MSGKSIRILIVDDHAVVRRGLKALLDTEPDMEIVGEAENGREAVEKVERLRPDIVLMDITMPELNGIEATLRIKKSLPEIKILALTMYTNEEYIYQLLNAGASGCNLPLLPNQRSRLLCGS